MLFFVLSGFVLTLPFIAEPQRRVEPAGFIVKRITRLYPAYWIALGLALGLRFLVLKHGHLDSFSSWANSVWALPISGDTLLRQFAMIAPSINTHGIDPVIWSLVIEMKVSLIFPAIIILVQKTSRFIYALIVVAAFVMISPHLRSLSVLPLFIAGSYLAKYHAPIRVWLWGVSRSARGLALFAGLLLYGSGSFLGSHDDWTNFVVGAGAGLLILLFLASSQLSKFASTAPVQFLGKVSYSFYLIHLPVLLAACSFFQPILHSRPACLALALAASLAVAKVLYETVERPLENYGRRIASRISRHRRVARPNLAEACSPTERGAPS